LSGKNSGKASFSNAWIESIENHLEGPGIIYSQFFRNYSLKIK